MIKKMRFDLSVMVILLATLGCSSLKKKEMPAGASGTESALNEAISQAKQVSNFFNRKTKDKNSKLAVDSFTLVCLEIGRLDSQIQKLVRQISYPDETFQDQRNDSKRDPIFSAHERVTALTGFCGELSEETVAGYRYMPKLKSGSKEIKAALELSNGIIADLERYKK